MNWLMRLWRAHQRWTDVRILWPECKHQCDGREHAELVFMTHMSIDPAYRDMSDAEKDRFVENLP